MDWLPNALIFFVCTLAAFAGTGVVRKALLHYGVVDKPNARSNHARIVARGGGLAIVATLLAGGAYIAAPWQVMAGIFLLATVSFLDDVRSLPAWLRLVVQMGVVALCIASPTLFSGAIISELLPLWLDKLLVGLLWLWFINLYNFMDGIDGITAVETLCICAGVGFIVGSELSLVVAAAVFGFLPWNWHKARIFLGDVGSVTLGFVVGFLLLQLAHVDYFAAALILPAYYLADSGVTLLRRIVRGEKFWQAHSTHFYQRAVRAGKSHATVVRRIALVNGGLVALALLSRESFMLAWVALGISVILVVGFLLYLTPREEGKAGAT